ncbi:hypothetical protein D3C71_290470 [compost metagenome]
MEAAVVSEQNAVKIVVTERAAQAKWEAEDKQSIGEEILLLSHYVDQARALWKSESPVEHGALREIVKIAAVALRCIENHASEAAESINKS